jgi:YVTN family beta-propeller protein
MLRWKTAAAAAALLMTLRCAVGPIDFTGKECVEGDCPEGLVCDPVEKRCVNPGALATDSGRAADAGSSTADARAPGIDGAQGSVDAASPPDAAAAMDAEQPDVGSPDSAGRPDAESPDVGAPDAGSPDIGSRDAGTPDTGWPADAGSTCKSGCFAYVANTSSHDVWVVNTTTLIVEDKISLGAGMYPLRMVLSADGTRLYALSNSTLAGAGSSGNAVAIIDTGARRLRKVLTVGPSPQGIDISRDGTAVYVAAKDNSTIYGIDTKTEIVSQKFSVSPAQPIGMAFSEDGREFWFGCGGNAGGDCIRRYEFPANKFLGTISDSTMTGTYIRFVPGYKYVYVNSGCGSCGNLRKISRGTHSVIWKNPWAEAGYGLAVSPDGTAVFAGSEGAIRKFDTSNNMLLKTASTSPSSRGMDVSPDGKWLYVARPMTVGATGYVFVYDTATLLTKTRVLVGIDPQDVVVSP